MREMLQAIVDYCATPVRGQLNQAQDEVQEEIQFHLESRMEDHQQQGLSVAESSAATINQFGDVRDVVLACCKESGAQQVMIHRIHLVLTVGLFVTASLLAFSVLSPDRMKQSLQTGLADTQPNTASVFDGDVAGLVVDHLGKPLAKANVLVAVKWWPKNGFRQQCYTTTTDSQGSFTITSVYPADMKHEVQVATVADDHLMTSTYISDQSQALDSLAIQLQHATADFFLEFTSSAGEPVPGVSAFPHRRVEATGGDHLVYFQSAEKIIRESDNSGRLEFSNFSPGDRATVYVRFPDDEWQQREIVVPDNESVVVITQLLSDTAGG